MTKLLWTGRNAQIEHEPYKGETSNISDGLRREITAEPPMDSTFLHAGRQYQEMREQRDAALAKAQELQRENADLTGECNALHRENAKLNDEIVELRRENRIIGRAQQSLKTRVSAISEACAAAMREALDSAREEAAKEEPEDQMPLFLKGDAPDHGEPGHG